VPRNFNNAKDRPTGLAHFQPRFLCVVVTPVSSVTASSNARRHIFAVLRRSTRSHLALVTDHRTALATVGFSMMTRNSTKHCITGRPRRRSQLKLFLNGALQNRSRLLPAPTTTLVCVKVSLDLSCCYYLNVRFPRTITANPV
jgi:hypothetical protein